MAKIRTYIVSFQPAERESFGGYTVNLSFEDRGPDNSVAASNFHDLETAVRHLAYQAAVLQGLLDFGSPCLSFASSVINKGLFARALKPRQSKVRRSDGWDGGIYSPDDGAFACRWIVFGDRPRHRIKQPCFNR